MIYLVLDLNQFVSVIKYDEGLKGGGNKIIMGGGELFYDTKRGLNGEREIIKTLVH